MVSKEAETLLNKFIQQVETTFNNLPKPLKWQSFLNNDLILLTDIPSIVQTASVKHDLNKAQTKALAKLEQVSGKAFQDITQKGSMDNWYFNDVDHRFGDDWPGRIPAQLVAHTLFYFTQENDLVFDPSFCPLGYGRRGCGCRYLSCL